MKKYQSIWAQTLVSLFILFPLYLFSSEPDWTENAKIRPGENRFNIYQWPSFRFSRVKGLGRRHALHYPVEITGMAFPYQAVKYGIEGKDYHPLRRVVRSISKNFFKFEEIEDVYAWLGLQEFDRSLFPFWVLRDRRETHMGVTIFRQNSIDNITFSCAACHMGEFLGRPIWGLTNRRPQANRFFDLGKKLSSVVGPAGFKGLTKASQKAVTQYLVARKNLKSIGTKKPLHIGLDTSLAQVGLSLARRSQDANASKSTRYQQYPRYNGLKDHRADSKPMPWWNVKYKTRWLSDGSVVSGNPIFTNFLWNEIGRGTDLVALEKWMEENQNKIAELTTAVFASSAPNWPSFPELPRIHIQKAIRGERIYKNRCQKCHGTYVKNWDLGTHTIKTVYHEQTPVKNVGTDPNRYLGTKYLASDLNRLKISKSMKTVIKETNGYVPPPLEGIFLRYPYLHNGSVANLCELLSPTSKRVKSFIQGPSQGLGDYDAECVGYPTGSKIPKSWLQSDLVNTRVKGASNQGHEKMLYDQTGRLISHAERMDLIEFLKTL